VYVRYQFMYIRPIGQGQAPPPNQRRRGLSTAMIARVGAGTRGSVTARLYLVHVRWAETHPPLWRRIAAPGTRRLHDPDGILQAAMGWPDYHLYQVEIGETRDQDPDPENRDPPGPDPQASTIDDSALEQGAKFRYTNDFGDD
jgi:pRiA4b ORF-3-like protein